MTPEEQAREVAQDWWEDPVMGIEDLPTMLADAIAIAVAEERERCAQWLEGITQKRWGCEVACGAFESEEAEGYCDLSFGERQLLRGIAAAIRARKEPWPCLP